MSTGGENAGSPVAQIDISTRLVNINEVAAQLLRELADLQRAATIPIRLDLQTTQGPGVQIQQAVDDAAQKLRFAFQTIGKAEDLQAGLRAVQSQLEQIVSTAGEINISVGGTSTRLGGKQSVRQFIGGFGQLAGAVSPGGEAMKLGISGLTELTPANMEAVGSVRSFADATKNATLATKKTAEEGEKLSKWLELWSSGGRPQRAIAAMMQGPMSGAFGAEGGAAAAGLAGMVGGGMLFHIGWAITDVLSKIPEHIGAVIAANQAADVARAGLVGRVSGLGEFSPIHSGALTSAEKERDAAFLAGIGGRKSVFSWIGGGKTAEEFQKTVESLQTESNKLGGTDAERAARLAKNIQHATTAQLGALYAGTGPSLTTASALREIDIGGVQASEAAGLLMKQPGVLKQMADVERKRRGWGTAFSDEAVGKIVEREANQALTSPIEAFRKDAQQQVVNAFNSMVQGPQIQGQFQTSVKQWGLGRELSAAWKATFGDKTEISEGDRLYGKMYTGERRLGKSEKDAAQAVDDYLDTTWAKILNTISLGPSRPDMERRAQIRQAMEGGGLGNMPGFIGAGAQPFTGFPMGVNPQFSFSSLSGFANKMQTEAGIQIDYPQQTAEATASMKDTLLRIETKLGGPAAMSGQIRAELGADVYEGSQQ
jgi:hypothetical protein